MHDIVHLYIYTCNYSAEYFSLNYCGSLCYFAKYIHSRVIFAAELECMCICTYIHVHVVEICVYHFEIQSYMYA